MIIKLIGNTFRLRQRKNGLPIIGLVELNVSG